MSPAEIEVQPLVKTVQKTDSARPLLGRALVALGLSLGIGAVALLGVASYSSNGGNVLRDLGAGLACADAEVQSPRDVSSGAKGGESTHGVEPLGPGALRKGWTHVNTHFHLGAEHKSDQYNLDPPEDLNRKPAGDHELRPGWFCDATGLTDEQTTPYDFKFCEGIEVGNTYEVHSVWSTGGVGMSDGLGGAFARENNAYVIVQAQVFVIVNDESHKRNGLADGWDTKLASPDSVRYLGSTTGTSFNNEQCSPYAVSWNVDRNCHFISASSFDQMCKDLKAKGLEKDLEPHASRELVKRKYVAKRVQALNP